MSVRHFLPPGVPAIPATGEDREFMDLAVEIGKWSKHEAQKIGAVFARDGIYVSSGFNGLARGLDDSDPQYRGRAARHAHSVHAEENAIGNAKRAGVSLEGSTAYVCRFPCAGCGDAMHKAGIREVVVYSHPRDAQHDVWTPSFRRSLDNLVGHGIELRWFPADDPAYFKHMTRVADTPPVPSGTTDWEARFGNLAAAVAGKGTGEVLVRRPLAAGDENDKIVRALGSWDPGGKSGALEAAARLGVSTAGLTAYVSALPDPVRLREMAKAGIAVVSPPGGAVLTREGQDWVRDTAAARRQMRAVLATREAGRPILASSLQSPFPGAPGMVIRL